MLVACRAKRGARLLKAWPRKEASKAVDLGKPGKLWPLSKLCALCRIVGTACVLCLLWFVHKREMYAATFLGQYCFKRD